MRYYLGALDSSLSKTLGIAIALVLLLQFLYLLEAEPHSDSHVVQADICWEVTAHVPLAF